VRPVSDRDPSQRETRLSVRQRGSQSETQTRLSVRPEVSIDQSIEVTTSPKPPKGAAPKKPSPETDPRVSPVIDFYAKTFEVEFKRKSATSYGRATTAIKHLPNHVTTQDVQRAVEIQLTQRRHDQYAKKRGAIDLHEIVGAIDAILAWHPAKSTQQRPPRAGEHGYARQPNAGNIDWSEYSLGARNG
jgi:hypothetical protein